MKISLASDKEVSKMKVGSKVISDYDKHALGLIRTITKIEKDSRCGSGYRASADGGEPCSACGRSYTMPVDGVDAAWFRLVKNGGTGKKIVTLEISDTVTVNVTIDCSEEMDEDEEKKLAQLELASALLDYILWGCKGKE